MTTEIPTKFLHTPCQTTIVSATRAVVSEPADVIWPRDSTVDLPYCPTCKAIVPIDEVAMRVPQSKAGWG